MSPAAQVAASSSRRVDRAKPGAGVVRVLAAAGGGDQRGEELGAV
jgi:hypothetical protein